MKLSLIVAHDKNGVIGNSSTNSIPWHLPPDLQHFKKTTIGHPIIMGKNTFLSFPKPLPKRLNIVISRQPYEEYPYNVYEPYHTENVNVLFFSDLTRAILYCESWLKVEQAFIIGGGKIYEEALKNHKIDEIYRTLVNLESEGDIKINLPYNKFQLVENIENEYESVKFNFQRFLFKE